MGKDSTSFWPNYVDIMTTLFCIMLVLFVVSYSQFKVTEAELQKLAGKYKEIENIYKTVENIDSTYFEYDSDYVKHIFKIQVQFQTGQYDLYHLDKSRYPTSADADTLRKSIKDAGLEIKKTIENIQDNAKQQDIKYLVVIEGQASADGYYRNEWRNNDVLSYKRAPALHHFWREHDLDFSALPNCELIICGSGEKGVPRSKISEESNQRFLIHIVPVIGNVSMAPSLIQEDAPATEH